MPDPLSQPQTWRDVAAQLQLQLPRETMVALMCMRRRVFWEDVGVIFVHIPKAAGTSISQALYGRGLGHLRATEIARYCPDTFARLPSFAVTRNPWDRAVSAYHFVTQADSADAGVWHPERYRGHAFRSFEAFIYEWLCEQTLDSLDYVFQPQASFVLAHPSSAVPIVDHVFKTEDMGAVSDYLRSLTGTNVTVGRVNASKRAADYRPYYPTAELAMAVAKLYHMDIERFQYDF